MVRFKNRYLLCELNYSSAGASTHLLSPRALLQAINSSLALNFGEAGSAQALPSLSIKYFSPIISLAIVHASRDIHRTVWAAITLINHIRLGEVEMGLCVPVVHLGGTTPSCQKAAAEFAKET